MELLQQLVSKQQTVRLMRVKQAAAYLAMSPGQLRALVQRGEIPKISTTENGHSPFLFDKLDLDQWIQRNKI